MRCVVAKTALVNELSFLSLGYRPEVTNAGWVRGRVCDDELRLEAAGRVQVVSALPALDPQPGECGLVSPRLSQVLADLPDQPLTLSTDAQGPLRIEWSTGWTSLVRPRYPPQVSLPSDATCVVAIDAACLATAIRKVRHCFDDMDARIPGVRFAVSRADAGQAALTVQATDGASAVEVVLPFTGTAPEEAFLLSKWTCEDLLALVRGVRGDVQLAMTANHVVATCQHRRYSTSQLAAGVFPQLSRAFVQTPLWLTNVETGALLSAMARVHLGGRYLRLTLSLGHLQLETAEAREMVPSSYQGETRTLMVSVERFRDVIALIDEPWMELRHGGGPLQITGSPDSADRFLIAPMQRATL